MANRIVDNVVIVDSAMGNNFILSSGGTIINISKFFVNTVMFWSSDTTGACIFTAISTADHVIKLNNTVNSPNTVGAWVGGMLFENMKIPTLTAGTAYLYLK